MLVNKNIIWQIKRYKMSNVYISSSELADMLDHLTNAELKLYNHIKGGVVKQVDETFFTRKSIAEVLNISPRSVDNLKAALKKKGYLIIDKFKDNRGKQMVRVIVGKDQVILYNLGLNLEITNAKAYNQLLKLYPVTDANLTESQRKLMIEDLNKYYLEHKHEFK
jgi:hypothetical protein